MVGFRVAYPGPGCLYGAAGLTVDSTVGGSVLDGLGYRFLWRVLGLGFYLVVCLKVCAKPCVGRAGGLR